MCLSLLGMMNTMSQVSTTQIPSSMTIQSSSMGSLVTAPLPVASAWGAKPHISYATATGSVEKPENHDSGVDVSDQPNSASSSTRSSPSAENKLKNEKVTNVPHPHKNVVKVCMDIFLFCLVLKFTEFCLIYQKYVLRHPR